MRRLAATITLALAACAPAARAGIYSDDLSRCLVAHTAPADQTVFMLWMFTALGTHPVAKSYMNMTEAQRDAADKAVAALYQRLMLVDCRKETVAALKYEGQGSLEAGFSMFGQTSMRGLMTDPQVNAQLGRFATHMDMSKFEELGKEAGIPPKPASK